MNNKLFSIAKTSLGSILVELGFTTPLRKIIPVKKVFEDDLVFAFYHPKPFWEKHIVIVPKKKISVLDQAKESDFQVVGHICKIAAKLVKDFKFEKMGYRIITNGGKYQKVKYLHFHLGIGKQIQTDEDGFNNSLLEN